MILHEALCIAFDRKTVIKEWRSVLAFKNTHRENTGKNL